MRRSDPESASVGLTAVELATRLRNGRLRAIELTQACLARVEAGDPALHAWVAVDAALARRRARELDAGPMRGPLHGLPIGIKDIIDTRDLPTEYGSAIYRGHRPEADAACVALARQAGAVVLGKTATSEFAGPSPAATVNPHAVTHTPGGSSSGSAAAVAAGMVPLAVGTQTAGSVIRPASFCGIVGCKPSYGLIARDGVKLVAESLDTVGVFARTVADAALLLGVLADRQALLELHHLPNPPKVGVCRSHAWHRVEPAAAAAFVEAERRLAASGAAVGRVELPASFAGLAAAHATIMGYEWAANLAAERHRHADALTARLRADLEAGARISAARYAAAKQLAQACRLELPDCMADCDVLLTPSTPGEAPADLTTTGDPVMNRVWTLLHGPCVNVPFGFGPHGLPLGLQVVGRRGADAQTLAAAAWIADCLAA